MLSAVKRQKKQRPHLTIAQSVAEQLIRLKTIGNIQKMKNKPKKLAAILELNPQELKYLLRGVEELSRVYISHCSRDYHTEDLHETVKKKIETAIGSFE